MATYVLVHGAWFGGWCWQRVTPLLTAAEHSVDALDLPGHGDDHAPISEMTLDANTRCIVDHVSAAGDPVVLVGHSMGGISITQAAERVPERIATLVYVTAFLPSNGQSLAELAEGDSDSLAGPNMTVDEAAGSCAIAASALRQAFFGECTDEDYAWAIERFVPESLAVTSAQVEISEQRAGSVPRVYVECLRDRAISIAKQREMVAARPCGQVLAIDADHAPFLSRPQELADHLLSLA